MEARMTIMRFSWLSGLMAVFSATGFVEVLAQEQPSFDCTRAHSQVEHVLCAGGNSGMGWIDQTMTDLYKAVIQSSGGQADALRASQRAWLARRDRCTGSEDKVMNCLVKSYRARYAEIAAPYDVSHLTGLYTDKTINGFLESVLFPDHSLAVSIDTILGAPSYNSCNATFRAPLQGDHMHYTAPPDPHDSSAPRCTIDLSVSHSSVVVSQSGCSFLCGANVDFAGTFTRWYNVDRRLRLR
jgi:uncharacterized protein